MIGSGQFGIFCTSSDLRSILETIELTEVLQFTRCGLFKESSPLTFSSSAQLPDLGISLFGESIREHSYLVTKPCTIQVETVPQRQGGVLFAVDQMMNQDSIELTPGGMYGEECLIAGRVATISTTVEGERLYDIFRSAFKRECKKVRSYWLGREALKLWKAGLRLTDGVRSPRNYDLASR